MALTDGKPRKAADALNAGQPSALIPSLGESLTGGIAARLPIAAAEEARQIGATITGGNAPSREAEITTASNTAAPPISLTSSEAGIHDKLLKFVSHYSTLAQLNQTLDHIRKTEPDRAKIEAAEKEAAAFQQRLGTIRTDTIAALKERIKARLALANDPDAERNAERFANDIAQSISSESDLKDGEAQTQHFDRLYAKALAAAKTFGDYSPTPDDAKAREATQKLVKEELEQDRLKMHLLAGHSRSGSGVDALMAMWGRMSNASEQKTIVQRDQLIAAGEAFIERARSDGLLRGMNPNQVKDAGLMLGVLQANIAERASGRQVVNVVIAGATHAIPATVSAALGGLGQIDLMSRNAKGELEFSGMDNFTASLKKAGIDFAGDMSKLPGSTMMAIGVSERIRVTNETWHAMLGTRDNAMLNNETLSEADIAALGGPEGRIIKNLVAQESARQRKEIKPSDLTLYSLSVALSASSDIQRIATMNTGSLAQATAQNGQNPYTISYHDVSMWGVLGGKPAEHMMKYARQTVHDSPAQRYVHHGRNDGKKAGILTPILGGPGVPTEPNEYYLHNAANPASFQAVPRPDPATHGAAYYRSRG